MPDQPRPSLDARRALQWALLALPLVVLAERAWARRWMSDDGFINLRVVRQITSGHGPVFNAGERVEASTSPLWTFVLTAGDVVSPVRLEWVAVLTGIALTLIGVTFAIDGSRRLIPARAPGELYVPVGAAVLVAVTPVWTFSSSGLEGGLTTAWLGASLWVLARWAPERARLPWWSAAVLGLGPLIRPDLGLFMVLFLAVVLVARRQEDRWADRGRFLAAALALPVAYQIFRMGYYASLVPNPALAKEAGGSSRWGVGWDYLVEFVQPYALWLPLLVLAVGAYVPLARSARREHRTTPRLVAGAFVAGGLLEALYIVRVGGDFMHARLLLPAFFAFVAPVAVVPLRREYALSLLVLPWCLVGLLFLRADADEVAGFGTGEQKVTLADFGWQPGGPQRAWFDGTGVYYTTTKLDAETVDGRRAEVASYGLGVIGYSLGPDVYVLDLLGLGDPFTSHLELSRRGLIGHEKPLPAPWIVARLTSPGTDLTEVDFPFPTRFGARPLDDPDGVPFADRVERARETLVCAELERFLDSYTQSLTPGRFLSNVFRAPGYTALRIPPEPDDAYRELCG
ncbi:MAG: hypothetical protein ACT4PI_05525 [Actinomycetota bacterium]